jgi:thiol:disulfide interchange protein
LQEARINGRPVFVDFAASWCKNCEAMDFTVFNQSNVQRRLKDFIEVRYQAERPNESPTREILDHFNVLGLPTYLVLTAK